MNGRWRYSCSVVPYKVQRWGHMVKKLSNISRQFTLTSLVVLALLIAGLPFARLGHGEELFHGGATGNCDGCHGRPVSAGTEAGAGNPDVFNNATTVTNSFIPMLKGSDPSSTCLICHENSAGTPIVKQHHIASSGTSMPPGTPPSQLTPGGDFGWLKKDYRWTSGRAFDRREERSPGERHGHNIVAADFNYNADTKNFRAPGGIYPANGLSCISCHDPHGNYKRFADGTIGVTGTGAAGSGSYSNSPTPTFSRPVGTFRLLAGRGYQPRYLVGGPAFVADPPAAVAPSSYNRAESSTDTRVAYGSGMSEWCQNCHGNIHSGGGAGSLGHPAGNSAKLTGQAMNNYNTYVASGNLNGSGSSSYTSLVPFEMGTSDYAALKKVANSDGSNTNGPDVTFGNPNVMCLTCHRAHASEWDSMTRWNTKTAFIVYNGMYPGDNSYESSEFAQGRTTVETRKGYYDRPVTKYASYQRGLCNKCHVKD